MPEPEVDLEPHRRGITIPLPTVKGTAITTAVGGSGLAGLLALAMQFGLIRVPGQDAAVSQEAFDEHKDAEATSRKALWDAIRELREKP